MFSFQNQIVHKPVEPLPIPTIRVSLVTFSSTAWYAAFLFASSAIDTHSVDWVRELQHLTILSRVKSGGND